MSASDANGFLTAYQREVMSAAMSDRVASEENLTLAGEEGGEKGEKERAREEKERKKVEGVAGPVKGVTTHYHHHQISVIAPKQERKSHTGISNNRPKKGGAGGKGTWGSALDPSQSYAVEIDPGDPMYDEEEDALPVVDAPAAQSVEQYKNKVTLLIKEYFSNADVAEAVEGVRELNQPLYGHYFVKRLLTSAMDRKEREREMAVKLLGEMYGEVLEREQVGKGFFKMLEALEDLSLDIPEACEMLSLFLSRSLVEGILSPSFLSEVKEKGQFPPPSLAFSCVRKVDSLISQPHYKEKLFNCFGGPSLSSSLSPSLLSLFDSAKAKISSLLEEYALSGDCGEAKRRIREVGMPFFHHEVVKRALILALDRHSSSRSLSPSLSQPSLLLSLLRECAEEGLITVSQMEKGFRRVSESIDDIALDAPNARDVIQSFVDQAKREGFLTQASAKSVTSELVASDLAVEPRVIRSFKDKCVEIISEYFNSGDIFEVMRSLEELSYPDFLHHFVKKIVTISMDRKGREREMASQLLSALYGESLPQDQIETGFVRLLESVDDLALDIPEAASHLTLFLARAVVDDILSPKFLEIGINSSAPVNPAAEPTTGSDATPEPEIGVSGSTFFVPVEGSLAYECLKSAYAMTTAKHAGERILRCWGIGASATTPSSVVTPALAHFVENGREGERAGERGGFSSSRVVSVTDAKERIRSLLGEYEAGGEVQEACKCIRELGMPFFHHELVKQAVVLSMEHKRFRVLDVLSECSNEGLISTNQMKKGFTRVADALADLALDIPDAKAQFSSVVEKAKKEKWLSSQFALE